MRPLTSSEKNPAEPATQAPSPSSERASERASARASVPPIHRLLSLETTRARVEASSRKRALEHGCEVLAASNQLNARLVLDALLARERLGTTALGEGVAIPHCRLTDCKTPVGVLLTLTTPIDYDAPDDGKVDLLFILVVPESANDEHLQLLSQLAGILVEADNRTALRAARDHLTLFETMRTCSSSASSANPNE